MKKHLLGILSLLVASGSLAHVLTPEEALNNALTKLQTNACSASKGMV